MNNNIKQLKRKNQMQAYLLLSPQIIGFFVFSIYPILWVIRFAFFEYDGITATFNGLDNFVRAFTRDLPFWKSIINTFIIAYGKLIIEIPLSLIVALLLSSNMIKIKKLYSIGFYLPRVTGTAVNCLIFSFLFATVNGKINQILLSLGIIAEPIKWFSNKWTAMTVIILQSLWSGFSMNLLYFMAGIQNIPEDVMEAARVDGATKIQTFFKVTLPMLAPVVRVILMLAMIGGMKMMNDVMLLTNGAPAGETNVVMLHIYKMYFEAQLPQYGYASCLGVIVTVIVGIMTGAYLKISKKADSVY